MRIGICEDNRELCDHIAQLCRSHADAPETTSVRRFYSADALWLDYSSGAPPYDLLFLDIELPGALNGLELAAQLRSRGDNAAIVLLTAFDKYALEGYRVQPYTYLLKPVDEATLLDVIRAVGRQLRKKRSHYLNWQTRDGMLRIPYDEVFYLESRNHAVLVHTLSEQYKQYCKLSDLWDCCDDRFIQCHKSYLVNADKIRQIKKSSSAILLQNGSEIPISKSKRRDFLRTLLEYDRSHEIPRH